MTREFIARRKTREKEIAGASLTTIRSAMHELLPANPVHAVTQQIIVSRMENALNAGKWYRKTSGHAPVFSLYTFFGNRLH